MDIFYIDIENFKKTHSKSFLEPYFDLKTNNEKRFWEYSLGRYLVKNVAKEKYNIEDCEIIINENNKPIFKNANLFFNISHSKNIVIACFDNNPCAIDIEFMKEKNLEKFNKYFKENFKTQEDFYKFWTYKEAGYKLGTEIKSSYFENVFKNYYMCAVSSVFSNSFNKLTPYSIA